MPPLLLPRGGWGRTKPPAGSRIDPGHPLTHGLVSYWLFGGVGGARLLDSWGVNHARIISPAGWRPTGAGAGFNLDGTASYAQSDAPLTRPDGSTIPAFTAMLWFQSDASEDFLGSLIGNEDGTFAFLARINSSQQVDFNVNGGADLSSAATVPLNQPVMVAVSHNSARQRIYLRGRLDAETANSKASFRIDRQIVFGAQSTDNPSRLLDGAIIQAAIWRRELRPTEVAALYADPYQMFAAPLWRRYFIPGSTEITGTGSITINEPALAATGAFTPAEITGTGAVSIDAPVLAATGELEYVGTAALTITKPVLAGDGTFSSTVTGTSALAIGPPALAAAGVVWAPQFARPTADVSDGSWTTDTGGSVLYAAIDEATASDADYIQSSEHPSSDQAKIRLGALVDPQSSSGHILRVRHGKSAADGEQIDLVVNLYAADGTTLVATRTYTAVSALSTVEITLTAGEADAIPSADYAAGLVVGLTATAA